MDKGLENNEEDYTLPSTADMLVCSSAAAGMSRSDVRWFSVTMPTKCLVRICFQFLRVLH